MSPLIKMMWLDAWKHLQTAKQSFDEARDLDAKELALVDMYMLSDSFKQACLSYAGLIGYERNKK